jgi:hypothetical protein
MTLLRGVAIFESQSKAGDETDGTLTNVTRQADAFPDYVRIGRFHGGGATPSAVIFSRPFGTFFFYCLSRHLLRGVPGYSQPRLRRWRS